MGDMRKVPDSTKSSLAHKLAARARDRWPQLANVEVTHRAGFAYVTGTLPNGQQLPLYRLRYGGSASIWASRSIAPATTTTNPTCYPPAPPPAAPRTPSTPPAASTSTTPPPGPTPRRT